MRAVRAAVFAGLVLGSVVASAAPAAAHGVEGVEPSNYDTRILGVTPRVRGVSVRVVDLGDRLELTNDTDRDVVVLGYEDEPYLRVGPRGTYENTRSPSRHLNRTRLATTEVPDSADPDATPRWHRVGDGTTVRWHDHRAHWMGRDDPRMVRRDPGSVHVIQPWRVEMVQGDTRIGVRGDLRWVPGPSPWPWLGLALGIAVALGIAGATRWWPAALGTGLVLVLAAQVVHGIGLWGGASASVGSRLGASAYAIGGTALVAGALVTLVRRDAPAAVPLALLGGLFLVLTGGLSDVTTLSHSQIPTTLAFGVDRLSVALTIGAGTAVAVVSTFHLRRPPAPREPTSTPPARQRPPAG